MTDKPGSEAIDEYLGQFPPPARVVLDEMRALIRATAPDANETMSYGIPTFDVNGKHLVHFGGWKKHVGFYPVPTGIEAFKDELAGYKTSKGSAQFPYDKPLPVDLIRRIVEFRLAELKGRES